MSNLVKEFNDYRTKMNNVIFNKDSLVIKRLWNLDTNTYAEGTLMLKRKNCWVGCPPSADASTQ